MAKRRKTKKRLKKEFKVFLVLLIIVAVVVGLNFKKIRSFFNSGAPDFGDKNAVEPNKTKLNIIDVNSNSRPIAVMINNHPQARPYQSGLQDAYLVYEIIVEGGLSRYMAVYKDADLKSIGSVRSSRHYFLDYALENDAVYVHWGWSTQAQTDISKLGVNNINGLNYEGTYFYRDNNLDIDFEHRGFTNSELIAKAIDKLGYRKTTSKDILLEYSVDEIDLSSMDDAIVANDVKIPYSGSTTTSYVYDKDAKVYKRYVNGKEHKDYVTKKQYTAKNIITYKVSNHTLSGDNKGRQDIDNVGSGTGYYITDGYAVPITWSKSSRSSQTIYKFANGEEINVNDGNTFIQIQPKSQTLTIS